MFGMFKKKEVKKVSVFTKVRNWVNNHLTIVCSIGAFMLGGILIHFTHLGILKAMFKSSPKLEPFFTKVFKKVCKIKFIKI